MSKFNSMRNFPEICVFLLIWSGYFFLLCVIPFHSLYESVEWAVLMQIAFLAIVSLTATAPAYGKVRGIEPRDGYLNVVVTISLVLSIIGLAASGFDKVFVQRIDYSDGLALARERISEAGKGRNGVSSFFSVAGYLLGYCYFVAVAAVVALPASVRMTVITIGCAAILLMIGSVVNASRSTIMLAVGFVPAMICVRVVLGHPLRLPSWRWLVAIFACAIIAFAFVVYMFIARAAVHGFGGLDYLSNMLQHLGANLTPAGARFFGSNWVGDGLAFIATAIAYVVHSAYTMAGIRELPAQDGQILMTYSWTLLSKTGMVPAPNPNWVLAGRFPSLPGALYHDAGYAGLLVGSAVLGGLTALARYALRTLPGSILIVGAAGCVYTTLFLSPLLFAPDFLAFPFIVFSFIVVAAISAVVMAKLHPRDQ